MYKTFSNFKFSSRQQNANKFCIQAVWDSYSSNNFKQIEVETSKLTFFYSTKQKSDKQIRQINLRTILYFVLIFHWFA